MNNDQEDPVIMYLVVNQDLNMSPGKIAAQACHCALYLNNIIHESYSEFESHPGVNIQRLANEWSRTGEAIVVLKAHKKEFDKLKSKCNATVCDKGLTQIPEGSYTFCGFLPMYKSNCPKELKRLQLL